MPCWNGWTRGGQSGGPKAARPDAVIAVVSDHGFAPRWQVLNPAQALIEAGLIRLSAPDPLGRVSITGWDAAVWASGGSFAVRLARQDEALRGRCARCWPG
jgi:hypothetical protein